MLLPILPPADANIVLETVKRNPYGRNAAIIGEVITEHPGRVVMKTAFGSTRIMDMLAGEPLPKIC